MGSRTMTWTTTGTEVAGAGPGGFVLPAFSGPFTIDITSSSPSTSIVNFGIDFYVLSTLTTCHTTNIGFVSGDSVKGSIQTVGVPGFAWSCLTWTNLNWYLAGPTSSPGAGITWTLVVSAPGLPDGDVGFCAYGTEQKDLTQSVAQITPQLAGVLLPSEGLWALPLALTAVGFGLALPALCSAPPPADTSWTNTDWTSWDPHFPGTVAQRKIAQKLQRSAWLYFCKCKDAPSGSAPPVTYVTTNYIQPTWYVSDTTNVISNTDIAVTLNKMLYWTTNQNIINYYLNTATHYEIQTTGTSKCPPAAYTSGTVHEGLTGEGRFLLGEVVGFKVEVTERPGAGLVLTGQPQYLWNMGWMSTLAGDALLEEKRVTREGYFWFPCSVHLATEFTWSLREFTEIRVTELLPIAPPALPPGP